MFAFVHFLDFPWGPWIGLAESLGLCGSVLPWPAPHFLRFFGGRASKMPRKAGAALRELGNTSLVAICGETSVFSRPVQKECNDSMSNEVQPCNMFFWCVCFQGPPPLPKKTKNKNKITGLFLRLIQALPNKIINPDSFSLGIQVLDAAAEQQAAAEEASERMPEPRA